MKSQQSQRRTRFIRSAVLSASLLSMVPLLAAMKHSDSLDSAAPTLGNTPALVSASTTGVASPGTRSSAVQAAPTATVTPATASTAATASTVSARAQSTSAQVTQSSYTRTRAS